MTYNNGKFVHVNVHAKGQKAFTSQFIKDGISIAPIKISNNKVINGLITPKVKNYLKDLFTFE